MPWRLIRQPLCPECYDYIGHVLFTWHAPELWHRFAVQLRRLLTRRSRDLGGDPSGLLTSYVKVVEMQRRAIPHFHAVVRLDGVDPSGEQLMPPDTRLDSTDLAGIIHRAAAAATLVVTIGGRTMTLGFGPQVDTRPLVVALPEVEGDLIQTGAPAIAGRRVAAYLAKYVTKSVVEVGLSARRLHAGMIDELDVSDHVREILWTISALAGQPDRREMANWLHTLGFRGHTTTKTRRYSTTMRALRAQRDRWRREQQAETRQRAGATTASSAPEWDYVGCGLSNEGERLLAVSAAERQNVMRRVAREELAERDTP